MSLKRIITDVVIVLFILLIGIGLVMVINPRGEDYQSSPSKEQIEELIRPEKQKIDSLLLEITEREKYIERLKDSIQVVEVIRPYEVEKIRKLPNTEAVEFLKNKLREYEEEY